MKLKEKKNRIKRWKLPKWRLRNSAQLSRLRWVGEKRGEWKIGEWWDEGKLNLYVARVWDEGKGKMHAATNEAMPKYTRQQMKQFQNDVEQPKTEAEMPKKLKNWTHVTTWNMGTIGISIYISFIRLSIDVEKAVTVTYSRFPILWKVRLHVRSLWDSFSNCYLQTPFCYSQSHLLIFFFEYYC